MRDNNGTYCNFNLRGAAPWLIVRWLWGTAFFVGRCQPLANQKRRFKRMMGFILASVIVCIAIAMIAVVSWYHKALSPISSSTKQTTFIVSRGETVRQVAEALKKANLIRSSTAFMYYYKAHPSKGHVQAGKYALAPNETPDQMIQVLTNGKVVSDAVTVTIPEGFNVEEIAARLQAAGVCSKQAFLAAVQHDTFKQSFIKQLSGRKGIRYRLEGFLFPDTYDFTVHEQPDDVINEMLNDFSHRVLTPDTLAQMKADHLSLNQLVTEASLVENEAEVESERPLIASVINNRLKRGMKLQIDATVEYALGHHVAVVTDKETKTKSPYNTYSVSGLPPGPIDNPGEKSINAVLHPAKTNYIYYVAKGDGSGEHYFSKTYSKQLHNEQLRAQNLKKAGQ